MYVATDLTEYALTESYSDPERRISDASTIILTGPNQFAIERRDVECSTSPHTGADGHASHSLGTGRKSGKLRRKHYRTMKRALNAHRKYRISRDANRRRKLRRRWNLVKEF
jgi:hypothetical protein